MNQFDLKDFENLVLQPQSSFDKPISLINNYIQTPNSIIQQQVSPLKKKKENSISLKPQQNSNLSIQQVKSIMIYKGNVQQISNKVDFFHSMPQLCNDQQFQHKRRYYSKISNEQPQRWSSLEKRVGLISDPQLDKKQQIFFQLYDIITKIGVSTAQKKHSILEDVLQLCIMYLPQIRSNHYQLFNQMLYLEFKEQFNIQRSFEAFKRNFFFQLKINQISSFIVIFQLLDNREFIKHFKYNSNYQYNQFLQEYCIDYDIIKHIIIFPNFVRPKKSVQKNNKIIKQIIDKSERKKIVLSITTKIIIQYIDIPPKEIDEDILQFEDEIVVIEMLVKLIEISKQQ